MSNHVFKVGDIVSGYYSVFWKITKIDIRLHSPLIYGTKFDPIKNKPLSLEKCWDAEYSQPALVHAAHLLEEAKKRLETEQQNYNCLLDNPNACRPRFSR